MLGAEQGTRCGKCRPGQRTLRGPETNSSDHSAVKMSHTKAGGQSHLDSGVQDLLTAQLSVGHPLHAFQGPDPHTWRSAGSCSGPYVPRRWGKCCVVQARNSGRLAHSEGSPSQELKVNPRPAGLDSEMKRSHPPPSAALLRTTQTGLEGPALRVHFWTVMALTGQGGRMPARLPLGPQTAVGPRPGKVSGRGQRETWGQKGAGSFQFPSHGAS